MSLFAVACLYWTAGLLLSHRHALDFGAVLHTEGPVKALSAIMRVSLSWPLWVGKPNRP